VTSLGITRVSDQARIACDDDPAEQASASDYHVDTGDRRTKISRNSCATADTSPYQRHGRSNSAARVLRRAARADGSDSGAKGKEMCQQWLSVAGLVLDAIGFLIIAFEWRHTYLHSVFLREAQVQEDHDRTKADEQGKNYEDSTQADASMWRHTKRENLKDNRYRARLFFVGVVLVIFGFLGQTLGVLLYGIPFFGFGNCSAVAG